MILRPLVWITTCRSSSSDSALIAWGRTSQSTSADSGPRKGRIAANVRGQGVAAVDAEVGVDEWGHTGGVRVGRWVAVGAALGEGGIGLVGGPEDARAWDQEHGQAKDPPSGRAAHASGSPSPQHQPRVARLPM